MSSPLAWDEIADVDPHDLTVASMPDRLREVGDLAAGLAQRAYSLDGLRVWPSATRTTACPACALPPPFLKFANEPQAASSPAANPTAPATDREGDPGPPVAGRAHV